MNDHTAPPSKNELVKVRLPLKPGEWKGLEAENVWAEVVRPGEYRVVNVPFFFYGLSAEDIVSAEMLDGVLKFTGIVSRGSHSTYRLLLLGGGTIQTPNFAGYWKPIEELGCTYELATSKWLAVDVPSQADIYRVYALLEDGERNGVWSFDEGHCGHPVSKRDGQN